MALRTTRPDAQRNKPVVPAGGESALWTELKDEEDKLFEVDCALPRVDDSIYSFCEEAGRPDSARTAPGDPVDALPPDRRGEKRIAPGRVERKKFSAAFALIAPVMAVIEPGKTGDKQPR